MSISPDGKFVAGINNAKKDRQFLMTYKVENREAFYYEPLQYGDVYDYAWASDNKLIYNVSIKKSYYFHMGVIDREMKNNNPFNYKYVGHIVDGIPADSTRSLIMRYDRAYNTFLRYVDLETVQIKNVKIKFKGMIFDCKTDLLGIPKLIISYQRGNAGIIDLHYFDPATKSWCSSYVPDKFKRNEFSIIALAQVRQLLHENGDSVLI